VGEAGEISEKPPFWEGGCRKDLGLKKENGKWKMRRGKMSVLDLI